MRQYYTMGFAHMRADLWDEREGVPVMIVASNYLSSTGRLRERPVPAQCQPCFCDSGGFHFHLKGTDYPFTYTEYTDWLTVMQPGYAATMDYPCEQEIAADDTAVLRRQIRTVEHAAMLLAHAGSWQWVPVLQGRTIAQYLRCAALYRAAGLVQPYMGIGSLCRRTSAHEIASIVEALSNALPETRFHLFGVKLTIFQRRDALPTSVESADSGAWNGMFGQGRARWKAAQARGFTQAQYEIDIALPAYRARVEAALGSPKQMRMEIPA